MSVIYEVIQGYYADVQPTHRNRLARPPSMARKTRVSDSSGLLFMHIV